MGVRLGRLVRHRYRRPGRALLLGCLLLIGLVYLIDRTLTPTIRAVAEAEARAIAAEAINRVVMDEVVRGLEHSEMVRYIRNQEGQIAALHANSLEVNRVAAQAATAIQREFRALSDRRFFLPTGHVTGLRLLAAFGPQIPLRFFPAGSVLVNIRSDFAQAGINQVRHVVVLETEARLRIVVPLITHEVLVRHELPLTESVIVGPVPQLWWPGQVSNPLER